MHRAGSGLAPTSSPANPRASREIRTPRSRRPQLIPPARGRDHAVVQSGSINHSRPVHSPKGRIWTRPGLVTALRTTRALLLGNAPCSRLLGVAPEQGRAHGTRALQLSGGYAPRRDLVPRPSPQLALKRPPASVTAETLRFAAGAPRGERALAPGTNGRGHSAASKKAPSSVEPALAFVGDRSDTPSPSGNGATVQHWPARASGLGNTSP